MLDLTQLFHNPDLLSHALTHRSYCNEHPGRQSNERLEFLGDSILSAVMSHRLFLALPQAPEGELTSRRSFLVQTKSLARKALDLRLDNQMLLSRGEEESGGRQNTSLLANTFEAVLGALYLDQGLPACQTFLTTVFSDQELLDIASLKDPKSLLQEQAQARGLGTPYYTTVSAQGPDHAKVFTVQVTIANQVIGTGTGASKQRAEAAAAEVGLTSDLVLK